MSDLDLCYLPAGEALRRFKAKTLSPVELMTATIARDGSFLSKRPWRLGQLVFQTFGCGRFAS